MSRLETLTQWLEAPADARLAAVPACVKRIREMDPAIHAWVQVSPQKPTGHGKLSAIPFAVKNSIETRGLATEYGSPIYKGRIGTADAGIVRELRRRGAILLGKTQTAAFAYRTPAPTRNPHNLEHTPGGSSSGSAAAVAAGMVPFSVGEQTMGSVLRPASYCGVTGFKPTYGLLSTEGVLPLAHSLDTLGFFTHTANDMLALWDALQHSTGVAEEFALGVPDPEPEVEPVMAAAFQGAIAKLRSAGVRTRPVNLAAMLAKLAGAARTLMIYEGARFHEARFKSYGEELGDLAALVREGLQISGQTYEQARHDVAASHTLISELYQETPVLLVPAATGSAPLGLGYTGDTRMNSPWTALGTPAIAIPMEVSANALPLGLQLTAERGQDSRVLRAAVRVQDILRSASH